LLQFNSEQVRDNQPMNYLVFAEPSSVVKGSTGRKETQFLHLHLLRSSVLTPQIS